jgi:hypothetical protein
LLPDINPVSNPTCKEFSTTIALTRLIALNQ